MHVSVSRCVCVSLCVVCVCAYGCVCVVCVCVCVCVCVYHMSVCVCIYVCVCVCGTPFVYRPGVYTLYSLCVCMSLSVYVQSSATCVFVARATWGWGSTGVDLLAVSIHLIHDFFQSFWHFSQAWFYQELLFNSRCQNGKNIQQSKDEIYNKKTSV